jgi:hypothetical protein
MRLAERILNPRKTSKEKYAVIGEASFHGKTEYIVHEYSIDGYEKTLRFLGLFFTQKEAEDAARSLGYTVLSHEEWGSLRRKMLPHLYPELKINKKAMEEMLKNASRRRLKDAKERYK